MSHEQHNSNDRLSAWGKAQSQTPSRNLEMKNVALFSLKPTQTQSKKIHRFFGWQYALSLSTVLGLVLIVGSFALNRLSYVTSSGKNSSFGSDAAPLAYNTSLEEVGVVQDLARNSAAMLPMPEQIANRFEKNVSDTREFLKTYYQATLRTRQVAKLAMHIQTMARGYGGRVDNISVNKESAYISFVVPKDKFEMLTNELRTLVGPKFIEEIISAQNLLSEKQGIENRTDVAEQSLDSIKKQREELIANHNTAVTNFQKIINNYGAQINDLRNQFAATTSTEHQQTISSQIGYATRLQNGVRQELIQENNRYEYAVQASDAGISAGEKRIDYLAGQDEDLRANVETVEASVSLQWISVWEIIELSVPIYWILSIIGAVSVVGYFKYGRRPKIVLP